MRPGAALRAGRGGSRSQSEDRSRLWTVTRPALPLDSELGLIAGSLDAAVSVDVGEDALGGLEERFSVGVGGVVQEAFGLFDAAVEGGGEHAFGSVDGGLVVGVVLGGAARRRAAW